MPEQADTIGFINAALHFPVLTHDHHGRHIADRLRLQYRWFGLPEPVVCKMLSDVAGSFVSMFAKIPYRIGCTKVGFLESKGLFLHKKTKLMWPPLLKTNPRPKVNPFTFMRLILIHKMKIILPLLPTQQKIVSILEKAEKAKEMRKEADELTNEFLKSVFMEMFWDKKWKGIEKTKVPIKVVSDILAALITDRDGQRLLC